MPNWKFLAKTVPEIWTGVPKFKKSRSRDPFPTPFDLIFHFLLLVPTMDNLHAKFEVSSSNRSRDREGVLQIPKVGPVTPSRPPLTKFFIIIVGVPGGQSACQIGSF